MSQPNRNPNRNPDRNGESVVSVRTMEIVTAALFAIVAAVVMYDSSRVGAGWASDGPEAGYFPFYVGLIMFVSSGVILVTNLINRTPKAATFVERGQLKLVVSVLVPAIVFVALIWVLGIYLAAAIFIAFFMSWLGRYPVLKILPIAILIPLALFVMFEIWFLVPLPKGPVEAFLGY
ncbi:tripartite tricarboxylate transporter TctB family protein (plasmid) [Skermanella mucosa]|uniref:tripartite tricarboxylate transporter TctB family protein n=1 Tax=Skermanella mucosa TaxID=1789672 RepID=UPI00192C8658|nr:tripartite tricarboxylate transporter TctB family protein [Skermanella mucosa]UEM25217.1 tripartite tricarboxylate transporter TctB family protein [Skermanella mucosa]